ncbi:hypothetical protein GOBAR_AA05354 [Gossypium barbadense]|uniref:Uncharacterized protein n=1 Tax=Gossypium barbadense TaxID=3634 RepID=A0A2P5YI10_GOSBA|nr:hypothetical protein GOBAR_AA05354 [Gossypium barbadense]
MPNAVKFLKKLLANNRSWMRRLTLQARNPINTDHVVQPSLQETLLKSIHEPCSSNNKKPIYEERRLQIEDLDEWRTHKPRTHDKPKPIHDKLNISPNQLMVGNKVLLDAADPRIATPKPNEAIPLTVLSIFPYGIVEVIYPKFGTFKSLNTAFGKPHGQVHMRVLGQAHTTGGDTAVRSGRVKQGKSFSLTPDAISCYERQT